MIEDNNVAIRELGFLRVLKARQESENPQDIHQSFGNLKHQKSISRLKTTLSFFTGKVIINELSLQSQWPFQKKSCLRALNKKKLDEKLFDFPCHTQAVKRCINLVTEISLKAFGKDSRDGFIRAIIESRQKTPQLESKKDLI